MAENKYEEMMLGRAKKALTDIPQAESKTADIRRQQQLQTEDYIRQQEARTAEYGAGLERISKQQQEGVKRAGEEYQRGMMKVDYSPTREEIPQLVQLFSTLTAAAFLAGGKGRQSGMGALAAMTGAMEGYRKGQKEVFDREIKEFDKRLREVQLHNEGVKRQYDIAMQTLQTNREAGLAELKKLEMMATNSKMAYDARRGDLNALAQDVKTQVDASNKAITDWTNYTRQKNAEQARERQIQMQERRLQLAEEAAARKSQATGEGKPPPKEIVNSNSLRNTLIPKLEKSIPVLDRLNKEKISDLSNITKWEKLTTLLGVDSRIAEYEFRNDPEAIDLILTLAYFRSKEFETAGKALTRNEDKILAPIVRGDLRVYEGIRNAMVRSVDTLKSEQKGFEKLYPAIKNYNEALRGETQEGDTQPRIPTQSSPQVAYMGNRRIVVRNNKWVYEDTGKEVR